MNLTKPLAAIACVALLVGASTSLADSSKEPSYTTAKMFADRCKDAGPDSWCRGFVTGFDQAHTTFSYMQYRKRGIREKFSIEKFGLLYCPPPNVSFGAAIDIVERYIHRNKDKNDLPAGIAVARALGDAYPCRN